MPLIMLNKRYRLTSLPYGYALSKEVQTLDGVCR